MSSRSVARSPIYLLAAVIAACCLAGSAFASPASSGAGALKLCIFPAVNTNNTSPTVNVKVLDLAAAGHRATFTVTGATLHSTGHLMLNRQGIALAPLEVTESGHALITVKVATRPATVRTVHVTLNMKDSSTDAGCVPR